jgi:hypothetical protein
LAIWNDNRYVYYDDSRFHCDTGLAPIVAVSTVAITAMMTVDKIITATDSDLALVTAAPLAMTTRAADANVRAEAA